LLKQEIDDKEKKILEVEAENRHLKAEIALASFAAEELFQFDSEIFKFPMTVASEN
jgi:membrane protein YqaA with SNARE-associated domain